MNRQSVKITQRDINLFHYLFRNKVASVPQINRDVVTEASEKTCYARLKKLERAGLLRKTTVPFGRFSAYQIGKTGLSALASKGLVGDKIAPSPVEVAKLEHDLILVDICSKIRTFQTCRSIVFENEIRLKTVRHELLEHISRLQKIPDAVLLVDEIGGPRVHALEYQRRLNDGSGWKKKLTQYYLSHFIDRVLLITDTEAEADRFRRLDREISVGSPRKLFATSLGTFLEGTEAAPFRASDGSAFSFEDARPLPNDLPKSLPNHSGG